MVGCSGVRVKVTTDILTMVINLERRSDRRDYMREMIDELGFIAEFINAVDGTDPDAVIRMGPSVGAITGKTRSRLDYACVSSHYKCWERLVASDHQFGLVLEDDVILSKDFASFVNVEWLPQDADIVKLETTPGFVTMDKVKRVDALQRDIGVLSTALMGAAAYVISKEAAERLLTEMPVPSDQIDWILFCQLIRKQSGFTIYQVNPAPAIQGMYHAEFKKCEWAESSLDEDRLSRGIINPDRASKNTSQKTFAQKFKSLGPAKSARAALKRAKKLVSRILTLPKRFFLGQWIGPIKFE
jgi:glycosyl transferase family 25